ncbi:GNAT family N-acetyltransferase [Ruminococcus sp. Marseille-P6503]|uniref:GNAT family N-acetyltransferase n=1 Tax=Ruminococcus sp. Marseille-P6503 TaxID=2364796 RepID=UPI000F52CCBE|nr:GNAT family N-acetyltransferase [Ruminococcus sp. Marseille-P6503]
MYSVKDSKDIIHMFSWCRDSMIISYSEGIIGKGYCDDLGDLTWAAVFTGDFCFLAGKPQQSKELAGLINGGGKELIIIPQTAGWLEPLVQCGCKIRPAERYHTKLPAKGFNLEKLEKLTSEIRKIKGASLVKIGEKEYNELRECLWENSFVSNFKDYGDYSRHGFGYIIFIDGEIASGASTFGYYSKGVELQIATNPKYRRMGLAAICAAQFIIECVRRDIRPHWDAANKISVKIAEKIGFEYDGGYHAFCAGSPSSHKLASAENKKTKGEING